MTHMPSAPIVDDLLSFARRDGDRLRVVLTMAGHAELSGRRVFVRFQNGEARHRFPATLERVGGRMRVEVSVARDELLDGVWRLRLRDGRGGTLHDLGARVLLHPEQPVALLFGRTANI